MALLLAILMPTVAASSAPEEGEGQGAGEPACVETQIDPPAVYLNLEGCIRSILNAIGRIVCPHHHCPQ